jgi:3-dehydroquinate synthase
MDLAAFRPATHSMQTVSVSFDYPVLFSRDCLASDDPSLAWALSRLRPDRRHRFVVCIDANVLAARPSLVAELEAYVQVHSSVLELHAAPVVVPGGEDCKNDPALVQHLLQTFAAAHLDRHSAVVCIGGGAVLDAVGYAAALVHRGVRLVRVPTTVLAQGDGGVGVKNGVNAFGAKNFLGTFAPPFAVINSGRWLEHLPVRDIRAGLAEAVKVACIRDAGFFDWLEAHASRVTTPGADLDHAVRRAAELHLEHIRTSGDPFELGSARPLDFGHWAAHKLEVLSQHGLRHGEAVSIGMQLDARYSERTGLLSSAQLLRLTRLLAALGLPRHQEILNKKINGQPAVLAGLEEFREHLGGELTVTLLQDIGRGVEVHALDTAVIEQALHWLATPGEVLVEPRA